MVFASFLPMLSIVPVKTNDFPAEARYPLFLYFAGLYTGFAEFIHDINIFLFMEKFHDACGDFRADFIYRCQIFLFCGNEFFHIAETRGQKLGGAFSDMPDAQSINEFIQGGFLDFQ
jgi:hypothetical protein